MRAAKKPSAAGADMRPHSARISSGSRQGPSGVHSRPQAPRTQPREKMAPLWVFTPPVARSMVRSASKPASLRRSKVSSGVMWAVSWPMAAARSR